MEEERQVNAKNRPLPHGGAFTRAGEEVDYFVAVVCTDRGQHKRRRLATVVRRMDGGRSMPGLGQFKYTPPAKHYPEVYKDSSDSHDPRGAFVFWCPSCPRTPQIGDGRWWAAVDEAARVGLREIDVSLIG